MSNNKCEYSPLECEILEKQIARRCKYREEYLKARTDPCKHASQAGYVFDEALQRFISLKATYAEHFQPSFSTSMFGTLAVIAPMFAFGALIYYDRAKTENLIRTGQIKYKDRIKKLI